MNRQALGWALAAAVALVPGLWGLAVVFGGSADLLPAVVCILGLLAALWCAHLAREAAEPPEQ